MKLAVLTVSVLLGLAQAADPIPIHEQGQIKEKFGYIKFSDANGKLDPAVGSDCTANTGASDEDKNCVANDPCELVKRTVTDSCATKRWVFTGYNRQKKEEAAWCPADGCPAWFGMAHVKINSMPKSGDMTTLLTDGINYAGQSSFKTICPYMCYDKAATDGTKAFKRCVKVASDCKSTFAAAASTTKTDIIDDVYQMSAKTSTADLNITSCPGCTAATCTDVAEWHNNKSKCKNNDECVYACQNYKWIHCNGHLRDSSKTEIDVGKCVDEEMKKIGCKHANFDDKCMPATGGASTAGGIAGALMAVAVALLH
eukprot:GHVU01032768.1.p1 GENE.GHVU01032768.1~~GHVU01032768.1.p1  ORF type:complete len:313 (+),score=49.33 GHVU01032768.1:81-1019(+)